MTRIQNRVILILICALVLTAAGCGSVIDFFLPDKAPSQETNACTGKGEDGECALVDRDERIDSLDKNKPPKKTKNVVSKKTTAPVKPEIINSNLYSIMIVGDSISVGIGQAMAKELKNQPVTVIQRGKISTGLNSPKFYNWQTMLHQFIQENDPDVLVVSIGGNDANNGSGSEAWAERFSGRASQFMQIAADYSVSVYWAGLPPMRDKEFNRKVIVTNTAMKSVCSNYSNCSFVDTFGLTSGETQDFIIGKDINGKRVTLRAQDGAHFTFNGYMVVARHILETIAQQINIYAE